MSRQRRRLSKAKGEAVRWLYELERTPLTDAWNIETGVYPCDEDKDFTIAATLYYKGGSDYPVVHYAFIGRPMDASAIYYPLFLMEPNGMSSVNVALQPFRSSSDPLEIEFASFQYQSGHKVAVVITHSKKSNSIAYIKSDTGNNAKLVSSRQFTTINYPLVFAYHCAERGEGRYSKTNVVYDARYTEQVMPEEWIQAYLDNATL